MTKRIRALIRRVSRMVEQMFDRQGDIDPIWLVETASGEQHTLIVPIIAPSPLAAGRKDEIAAEMREYFAEHDIVRYARAVECWTLIDPEVREIPTDEQLTLKFAVMGYTFANHPDRREIVSITADDGTEVLTAERDINRPAHGKPYLGKLGPIERFDGIAMGRWAGLLPSKEHAAALLERPVAEEPRRVRFSSELPDDIGRAFVTAVPNAPIQLTGRRDPATGELCVGAVMGGPKDAPWPPPDTPNWIEIVTGRALDPLRAPLAYRASRGGRAHVRRIRGETFRARAGAEAVSEQPKYVCKPHEIVPEAPRHRLGWDARHDRMAAETMAEFKLVLPPDRELIRQRALARVERRE